MANSIVTIKSFPNGFDVILNPDADFEELVAEVSKKFGESARFFGKARRAISFSGRKLSAAEEDSLIEAISTSCEVQICCILEKDDENNDIYLKAMKKYADSSRAANGQIYKGTLRSGQILKTDDTIIVLGDVNPGASVISGGSVIILGTLYGSASAGAVTESADTEDFITYEEEAPELNESCFIAALEMKPQMLSVNAVTAPANSKAFKSSFLTKKSAKIAYEMNGLITVDAISGEFLNNIPF